MKKTTMVLFLLIVCASPGFARDFIVEFVEENYKETQAQFSYDPLIYHSIQVNSNAGPKILILSGKDYSYRKWLRHYIAQNKKFITKVEDSRADEFITSIAYEVDVTSLHPFNGEKWKPSQVKASENVDIRGSNNILIVDPNQKRTQLVSTVIEDMGHQAVVFSSAQKALETFALQPQRFMMVMTYHALPDMASQDFVDKVIQTNHLIPVVIDIGYNNPQVKQALKSKFAGSQSVHLKQVILRELPKTIEMLMKKSV